MEGSGNRADAFGFLCLSGIQGNKLSGGQRTSLLWSGSTQRCAWLKGSCGFVKRRRFGAVTEGLQLKQPEVSPPALPGRVSTMKLILRSCLMLFREVMMNSSLLTLWRSS